MNETGSHVDIRPETAPQHTPGPWDSDGLRVAVFGRGIVAVCPRPNDGGVFECSANARLIAAAPDMLAALRMVLKTDDRHDLCLTDEERETLCAAIANAEGRA